MRGFTLRDTESYTFVSQSSSNFSGMHLYMSLSGDFLSSYYAALALLNQCDKTPGCAIV